MRTSPNQLSFVSPRHVGGGFDYWSVPAGHSYSEDCETGERLAEEFIGFITKASDAGSATLLGSIMLAMEENHAPRGHKIGFMNTINRYAMVGGYADRHGVAKAPTAPAPPVTLISVVDQIGHARSLVDLIAYALESMSAGGDRQINALQFGIGHLRDEVRKAGEMIEAIRVQ